MRITRRGSKKDNLAHISKLLGEGFDCWLYLNPKPTGLAYLTDGQTRVWVLCSDAYDALVLTQKDIFERRGPWVGYVALYTGKAAA